jgi:TRAP transporter TAXI family solute receptor
MRASVRAVRENDHLMHSVKVAIVAGLIAVVGFGGQVGAEGDVGSAVKDVPVTVATGRVGGLYHPVGGAICKLVNENRVDHGISCTVEVTGGSIPNIRDLQEGNADLALAQSDELHRAYFGNGAFRGEGSFKYRDLRLVFGLYVEHFTVVARDRRGMDTFEDLKGKRVYVGEEGSSRRNAMKVLMDAYGWTGEEVTNVSTFRASNLAEALCDDEFDAFVYTIGHPNPTVREAATLCDMNLLDVSNSITETLARQNPFYVSSVIKGGTYSGNPRDTSTLGVPSMLATTDRVDPDVIYQFTKAFFESLDLLQALSPLFLSLTREQMVESDLDVPFHEGALRYFSEVGLK